MSLFFTQRNIVITTMFICGILCVLCLNVQYTLQILGNYTSQPLNRLNFHTSTKFCGCDTILQNFAKFCITTLNLASLLQISAYPIFQMTPLDPNLHIRIPLNPIPHSLRYLLYLTPQSPYTILP